MRSISGVKTVELSLSQKIFEMNTSYLRDIWGRLRKIKPNNGSVKNVISSAMKAKKSTSANTARYARKHITQLTSATNVHFAECCLISRMLSKVVIWLLAANKLESNSNKLLVLKNNFS